MAEGQHTTAVTTGNPEASRQEQNNPFFFLSLIPKFLLQPFNNIKNKGDSEKSVKRVDGEEGSGSNTKTPDVVRFPATQPEVAPLKLENEDAQEDTNPLILWQIYALGGFIVLKWAWGKWQERKANNGSSGEDQPQPPPSATAPAPAED
uniref:E24 ASN n=1 Tax=Spinacia oleracea TaxID=3562 RepID=Q41393_SPIOL|nr:E24 ASN [Spinacia oleracea]